MSDKSTRGKSNLVKYNLGKSNLGKSNPDEPRPDKPAEAPDLARFFQDWMSLWREESRAQSGDPSGGTGEAMTAVMDLWRAAIVSWVDNPPSARFRERAGAS